MVVRRIICEFLRTWLETAFFWRAWFQLWPRMAVFSVPQSSVEKGEALWKITKLVQAWLYPINYQTWAKLYTSLSGKLADFACIRLSLYHTRLEHSQACFCLLRSKVLYTVRNNQWSFQRWALFGGTVCVCVTYLWSPGQLHLCLIGWRIVEEILRKERGREEVGV